MPLNFQISYPASKNKNPVRALYWKTRAIFKPSKIKQEVTMENIIFKENSEYANLLSQINSQRMLQSELHNKIYILVDQYKTSVAYVSILEEQCKNINKPYDEVTESTEESIELYIPPRPFYKRLLDLIYNCFDPSTKCMTLVQGL
jgi:hypothetical protein